MKEMMSCEEAASEISDEFILEERVLVRKPTSLSHHVSVITYLPYNPTLLLQILNVEKIIYSQA